MKDLVLSIINIFKYTGKFFTVIRNFFFNSIFILIAVLIVYSMVPEMESVLPDNSILRLDISGNIVEQKKPISSIEKFLATSMDEDTPDPETLLQDILDTIETSTQDEHISVILLNLKNMGRAGLNQMQAIGRALNRFKATGKTIIAAEDYYSQSQYYLASYANTVIINPMGGVDLHGFGVYKLYFKKALEKLAITYNIFKIGTYKSAVEPFTREDMSAEDRLQNEIWLSALWKVYTDDIKRQRQLEPSTIGNYTSQIDQELQSTQGNLALLAKNTGLVDKILTRSQVKAYLSNSLGLKNSSPHIVSSATYMETIQPSFLPENTTSPKIGLIVAEGNILPGKQKAGLIGGDSLAALLKKARKNDQVKAIVLRINSGGGSAFASEIIRQELLELKKSGKPIVVSMGSMAASGGYWIAADADEIWANPATLTGSIGIFGAIPTFEKSLENIGVNSDGTGTTPLAAGLNMTRPLPEQLKSAIQQTIAYNYDQFITLVADGRKIEKARVGKIAQGRVYDGTTALSLGLVDKLGSLSDAITSAAERAHIKEYSTEYIQPTVSVQQHFLQLLATSARTISAAAGANIPFLEQIHKTFQKHFETLLLFDDPNKVYAHCLINISM